MTTTIFAGFMSLSVHFLNKVIPENEYSNFGVLLMVATCIPTMPLQMVFAQQAASTLASNRERQLAGMIRHGWFWTFALWLIAAVPVVLFRGKIVQGWHLANSLPLFVTLGVVLASMWLPLFSGVLQGRQDFFWLGWSFVFGGILRAGAAALLVIALHIGAAGMIAGALAGVGGSAIIVIWRTRDLWGKPPEPFDKPALLSQILPLILGFGVCQFLFTTDTMFATPHFSGDDMKRYVAAGTLSRALLWLVLPLAAVMFPKIVHSSARREKTNLLGIVILGTAILAICGTVGLCVLGPWVVRLIFKPEDVAQTTALLPWYAAAIIPLALANVLVNNLMARGSFKVVPFMILVAIGYGFTLPYMLNHFPGRMTIVLQTLSVFTLLLFVVCAWFTWVSKDGNSESKTGT